MPIRVMLVSKTNTLTEGECMRLSTFSIANTSGLLLKKDNTTIAAANAYKLGEKYYYNTSIEGKLEYYKSFEEAKQAVLNYRDSLASNK
jgi:hypothetical protein